jgi:non-ribosomal peptide synthetase component E (peptide arylation enzyme)
MKAADGKLRLTDVADTEQLLRLIQSIPSKRAEPFKLWLAQVGSERLDEPQAIRVDQKCRCNLGQHRTIFLRISNSGR